ncbi:MAG TPA: methylamine dehydrogenase light chain [Steroidobacteraceae bacterium]|nr:methylamine dehydrogenase light chain [Steroidobacteraceae bacterium]
MQRLDRIFESSARSLAQRTSRRSFIGVLGQILTGSLLIPLLPIDRIQRAEAATGPEGSPAAPGKVPAAAKGKSASKPYTEDQQSCEYWKYCAIDGFLCSCCGGSSHTCPPGTQMSVVSWIGTCHNPADGRDYIVSYNDCCGKASCGNCDCYRNERERPLYRLSRNNDVNWCMANTGSDYHCTVSVILGSAGP